MNGYFDNAATTYKKPDGMYAFAAKYMSSYGANVGRGDYEQSLTSGKLVSETRSKLLTLVGAPGRSNSSFCIISYDCFKHAYFWDKSARGRYDFHFSL